MIAASDYPDDEPYIDWEAMEIYVMDWQVMDYLARQLVVESNGPRKETDA